MKQFGLIAACIFIFMMHCYSQNNPLSGEAGKNAKKNNVKINYLVLPAKAFNLSYERSLGNYVSILYLVLSDILTI